MIQRQLLPSLVPQGFQVSPAFWRDLMTPALTKFCGADFELVPEEGSCVYVKKEIGEGVPCDGKILEATQ